MGGGSATGGGSTTGGGGGSTTGGGGGSTTGGGGGSATGGGGSATGGGGSATGGGGSATGGGGGAATGGGGGSTTGGGGGSTAGGGGGSATGGGGGVTANCERQNMQCNNVIPGGNAVAEQYSAATPPTPQGGVFVDGTYHLTGATIYTSDGGTGPSGNMRRQTSVYSAGTVQIADEEGGLADGGCAIRHQTGTVATTGASPFVFTPTCPNLGSGQPVGYSVTSNGFILYIPRNGVVVEQTFTRQ